MELSNTNDSDISFVQFDPEEHSTFFQIVPSAPLAARQSHAVVVTNNSDMRIMAVAVRWKVTDGKGSTRVHTRRFDGFFPNQRAVISQHQQTLFWLGAMLRADAAKPGGAPLFPDLDGPFLDQFSTSTRIVAGLDVVIFEGRAFHRT